ncbi:hypothetical protein DOTSEDRAFT_75032 [Dothistroma septosporum NZE10]|uniref:Zn(2)-C6 fungal-type domain-containing protein n=1 Tax=Dothistroma septosporum (strain NZE10 / CBS 128990) TaxID=675120 RepID=M2WJJ9_DOTSN|nr:hypothetical protein DOTSEDRAFT_75032 [Dothistroma septosporum NZE10]
MQAGHREESSSCRRPEQLRTLAPRDSKSTSTRERTSASSTGRPPRLSHRSRAGCWTCRGRKVKCDEMHPRCGPCSRLNRECDWDYRWNFSDATPTTQGKFSNVITSGNAVWDPAVRQRYSASPLPEEVDHLPEFACLASDEERERKAEAHKPGTFGVIVTPESFLDLPEYASSVPHESRRASGASHGSNSSARGSYRSPRLGLKRGVTLSDPNTIVLDRFEDSPVISPISCPRSDDRRRASFPEVPQRLSITTSAFSSGSFTAPQTPIFRSADDHLLAHFKQYIVPRLAQPQPRQVASIPGIVPSSTARNTLELEAHRFRPLHNAICAVSALHLAYSGRSSLEDAMQHYHQALAASATATSPNDLISDCVFFRHFLLFVYDICIPMQNEDGANMWAEHLNHLRRIAAQRRGVFNNDSYSHTVWVIMELDIAACLLGSGNCDFVRTIMDQGLLPPLAQQIPSSSMSPGQGAFSPEEAHIFPPILALNQSIVLQTAALAQTAQRYRLEARSRDTAPSPGTWARLQANSAQLQGDMHTTWQRYCPEYLVPYLFQTGVNLPERVKIVFEQATLRYHAAIIYARTSMFPGQRSIPFAGQQDVVNDTERRVATIMAITSEQIKHHMLDQRGSIFPLFIAAFATGDFRTKEQIIDQIRAFEGQGIGQNTYRTRQLLVAVRDEQLTQASMGPGRMERVDWLEIARQRGLKVVNCGL